MKKIFHVVLALAVFGAATAFAAREVGSKDFSGWMEDYGSLTYVEEHNAFLFSNEEKRGHYEKVIFDGITVYAKNAKANGEMADKSTDYLTAGVRTMLDEKGVLTTEPGPNVLRYHMAITGVEKSKEDLKAHNVIPVSALFRGAKAATGNLNTYIDAMFEAEMVDSITGERIMAIVRKGIAETEKKSGDKLEFEDVKPTLDIWLEAYSKTLDEFLAKRK